MRKIFTIILCIAMFQPLVGISQCTDPQAVIEEDFNALTCWSSYNGIGASGGVYRLDGPDNNLLSFGILPKVNNARGVLTFEASRFNQFFASGRIDIGTMPCPTCYTQFNKLFDYTPTSYTMQPYSFDFSAYAGTDQYIAFRIPNSSSSNRRTNLDNLYYRSECLTSTSVTTVAQDITVSLDHNGNANITPEDIDNGSITSCGDPANLSLDITSFSCSDIGANTVTLTTTDDDGNSNSATAIVTVNTEINLSLLSTTFMMELDASGYYTLQAEDLDAGSTTSCGGALTYSVDRTAFSCVDAGLNVIVNVTATDDQGNTASGTATVRAEDSIDPVVLTRDITLQLDATTNTVEITPEMIDNGSSDNCVVRLALSKTTFTCEDLGENEVTLTVIDNRAGNVSQTAKVTVTSSVIDQTVSTTSTSFCPDGASSVTIDLGGSELDREYYLRNSADNAIVDGPVTGTGSPISFTASNISETTTFNVFAGLDSPGNGFALEFEKGNQYVNAGPDADFEYNKGYTIETWVNAPFSTANSHAILEYGEASRSDIQIYVQGGTGYLTIVHDRNGSANSFFQYPQPPVNQWVHIAMTHEPGTGVVKVYYNGVVQALQNSQNRFGNIPKRAGATLNIGRSLTFASSNDNFEGKMDELRIWSTQRTPTEITDKMNQALSGNEVGLVSYFNFNEGIGLTATDIAGGNNGQLVNMDPSIDWVEGNVQTVVSCGVQMSTEVTVGDLTAPVAVTKDVRVFLDATGNASISPEDINDGSTDNCTAETALFFTLDKTDFTSSDVGNNTVLLTVADAAGNEATVNATVTVIQRDSQQITFSDLSDLTYGAAVQQLNASASSGLVVDFYVVSGPATIEGNELTITGAGTVVIAANQAGDNTYDPATPVQQSLIVNPAALTVIPDDKLLAYGDAIPVLTYDVQGFVNGENVGVITNQPTGSTTASASSNVGTYDIVFSGGAATNYEFTYQTGTLTIRKAEQEITFNELSDIDLENTDEVSLTATASSGLAISYEVVSGPATLNGNTLSLTGTGTVSISASQEGNGNYEAAEVISQTFNVFSTAKDTQSITFEALPEKAFGEEAFELNATSSSGLVVSFSSSDETVATINGTTVTILGAGTSTITASQEGDGVYNPAPVITRALVVNKADQVITIENIPIKDLEAADFEIVASSTSGLELVYAVLSGPATISENLISLTGVIGTVEIEVSQAGNSNYNSANATTSFEVLDDPCAGFTASTTIIQDVSCNGEANGSFEVNPGNGTAPFTYTLGDENQDNGLFENLSAGSYEVTITDANGCIRQLDFTITEPVLLDVTATVISSTSINGNGSISLSVTGGTASNGEYQYSWDNGASSSTIENLIIGDYTVKVTDDNGCTTSATYSVGGVTSNKQSLNQEVSIYPNPAQSYVFISQKDKISEMRLYNSTGQLMYANEKFERIADNKVRLNTEGLLSGLYFLQLTEKGNLYRLVIK